MVTFIIICSGSWLLGFYRNVWIFTTIFILFVIVIIGYVVGVGNTVSFFDADVVASVVSVAVIVSCRFFLLLLLLLFSLFLALLLLLLFFGKIMFSFIVTYVESNPNMLVLIIYTR